MQWQHPPLLSQRYGGLAHMVGTNGPLSRGIHFVSKILLMIYYRLVLEEFPGLLG